LTPTREIEVPTGQMILCLAAVQINKPILNKKVKKNKKKDKTSVVETNKNNNK
jgi:hypothetical protein